LFNIVEDIQGNEKLFNIFKSYDLNDDMKTSIYFDMYEVGHDEWWENISYYYYNTPYLWWIILLINETENPFECLEEGIFLKILRPEYIYQLLKEIKSIGEV